MRKVTSAEMHETTFVANVGALKKTLDDKSYKGLKMALADDCTGVIVDYKNVLFIIPFVNFKNVVIERDAETKKGKAAETKKTEAC